jgi:tetratricopeptide (TPR) repeat protein
MRPNSVMRLILAALVAFCAVFTACNSDKASANPPADNGKVPITTKSEEAKKEYLEGRDLTERLLAQESVAHFDKAIALDPTFAAAELARSNNSPTAAEFFDHLNRAVSLAGNASNGEQLLITAAQAGSNGDNAKQKDALEKLVASYPQDERAQVALGNYYFFVAQEYPAAIDHYKKATEIAPNFSPAYNILGYSYRQVSDYPNAEQTFKKYTELLPNDPNPYDSYAELLLKMGRFDDSLTQYQKALSVDPHFVASHSGIAADLMYQGKYADANAELQKMADGARNDGELRTAYFGMAVVASDAGKFDQALAAMDKEYAVAEKKNDVAAMSADLQAKGNILLAAGKYDQAAQQFDRSAQMVAGSSLSQEIKDNSVLLHHFNLASIAIEKKDYAAAKKHADEFNQGLAGKKNAGQEKQSHELAGRMALGQKNYDEAISELQQANLQDPRNLLRISQAYQAKGDTSKAQDYCAQAADFNSLPALNYAFIRTKAVKMKGKSMMASQKS